MGQRPDRHGSISQGDLQHQQVARWSKKQDSSKLVILEVDNNIEMWLVGVTSTRDDALLQMVVVDEHKMWKLAGAKACKSLEILLFSE